MRPTAPRLPRPLVPFDPAPWPAPALSSSSCSPRAALSASSDAECSAATAVSYLAGSSSSTALNAPFAHMIASATKLEPMNSTRSPSFGTLRRNSLRGCALGCSRGHLRQAIVCGPQASSQPPTPTTTAASTCSSSSSE